MRPPNPDARQRLAEVGGILYEAWRRLEAKAKMKVRPVGGGADEQAITGNGASDAESNNTP